MIQVSSEVSVLLAEDNAFDARYFKRALRHWSLRSKLTVVNDGEAVLERLEASTIAPDILILDINMPRLSGLEALSHIRSQAVYDELPIAIMTTSDSQIDMDEAYMLGVNAYLLKDDSDMRICATLSQLLGHQDPLVSAGGFLN